MVSVAPHGVSHFLCLSAYSFFLSLHQHIHTLLPPTSQHTICTQSSCKHIEKQALARLYIHCQNTNTVSYERHTSTHTEKRRNMTHEMQPWAQGDRSDFTRTQHLCSRPLERLQRNMPTHALLLSFTYTDKHTCTHSRCREPNWCRNICLPLRKIFVYSHSSVLLNVPWKQTHIHTISISIMLFWDTEINNMNHYTLQL